MCAFTYVWRAPGLICLAVIGWVGSAEVAVAQAGRDPSLEWRTIRTEHFEVTYHEPLGEVARRAAAVCERAHATLAPALDHWPDERTRVVLTDDSDFANGSASVAPYNAIRLFASGPGDLSALEDYDDWLSELIIHEHTHVLHLDTIGGLPAIVNAIFGKIFPPNSIQPRWFIEGLATHEESRHTSGGRVRGSQFEMYLRMDTLEDRLLGLDELSNSPVRWPHGNSWYLYGSRFVRYIADRFGEEALARISHEYGSEIIPYGLNRVCRRATGHTFEELYEDWKEHLREHYGAVRDGVVAEGVVAGERITFHAEDANYPRFLPDGRLVYWASTGRETTELRTLDPVTGAGSERFLRVRGQAVIAPHPGGGDVYFSEARPYRDRYVFQDLAVFNEASEEVERLTDGLRASMPDVSPDGQRIAFVVNGRATRHLAVSRLSDIEGTMRYVVRSRRYEQVYTPRWSPDGRTIAYSAWRQGGYRDIILVDLFTGRRTEVTSDRALDMGPVWSPDGQWLYFSSDRSGIANVYAFERATGRILRVTNVVSGAYQPAISPSGERLVYLGYSSRGFDLWSMALDPDSFEVADPYIDRRPPPSESDATLPLVSEPYNPLPTLAPRAYQLELGTDGFGSQLVISVAGDDIAGWLRYAGTLAIGLTEGDLDFGFSATLNRAPLPISLSLFRQVSPRGGFFAGGISRDWVAEEIGGTLGLSYPLPGRFHFESLSMTYTLSHIDRLEDLNIEPDPNQPPPRLPNTGLAATLGARWFWSDAYRTTYDISNSWGRTINLSVSLAHPILGSQFEAMTARWSITQYLENPWIEHHVLALRYAGGLSTGAAFGVGGFPQQSILQAFLNQAFLGGQVLRGYPQNTQIGNQLHLIQAEYRFPIADPTWSVGLLPLYVARIWGSVFFDTGTAFNDFDTSNILHGAGGEVLVEFIVGYFIRMTLRLGAAYGFADGGQPQMYFNLGTPFP